jgi:hypothetical protein
VCLGEYLCRGLEWLLTLGQIHDPGIRRSDGSCGKAFYRRGKFEHPVLGASC